MRELRCPVCGRTWVWRELTVYPPPNITWEHSEHVANCNEDTLHISRLLQDIEARPKP